MDKYNIIFLAFAIFGIGIVFSAMIYTKQVLEPQHTYISQAVEALNKAQKIPAEVAPALELKLQFINQALQIYKSGPARLQLEMLASLKDVSQIDYFLPTVISALNNDYSERNGWNNGTLLRAIPVLGFIIVGAIGTYYDWHRWSNGDQAFFLGVTAVIIILVFVALLTL